MIHTSHNLIIGLRNMIRTTQKLARDYQNIIIVLLAFFSWVFVDVNGKQKCEPNSTNLWILLPARFPTRHKTIKRQAIEQQQKNAYVHRMRLKRVFLSRLNDTTVDILHEMYNSERKKMRKHKAQVSVGKQNKSS